jgi:hypothetical protein
MATNSPYRTSSDLITLVLQRTGLLSSGSPQDNDDTTNVQSQLDPIFRKLAALEIVFIADPDNIPGAFLSDLADIVAGECASALGIGDGELPGLVNKGLGGAAGTQVEIGAGTAAKSLKIMTRGKPTYEIQRIQNF